LLAPGRSCAIEHLSLIAAWQQYRAGQGGEAWSRLVAGIRPRVLGLAKKKLFDKAQHEDVAQSVLLSFLASHVAELARLDEPGEVWELFASITVRHCNKHNKRHHREQQRGTAAPLRQGRDTAATGGFEPAAADLSPDEQAALNDLFAACKQQLSERQQAVLVASLAGLQRRALAGALQVAIPTIDRELKRVREVLAALAGDEDH
jgi:RNA polymerase sigma factor (sigma-70 family)